jgi:hypothetical protein
MGDIYMLSLLAFIGELILFFFYIARSSMQPRSHSETGQGPSMGLVRTVAVLGAIAWIVPVLGILHQPSQLPNIHPFYVALLIGAPAMPIFLFRRRRE